MPDLTKLVTPKFLKDVEELREYDQAIRDEIESAPMASQHADQVVIEDSHCAKCKYTRCRDRKHGA